MTYFDPATIAAMNASINTPPGQQSILADPMGGLGRMGDAFSALPTDPLFMTSLGLLTNDGRLTPGMAQNAVLMQQMKDRKAMSKAERERLKEKERKARAAQAEYMRGLLDVGGGASLPAAGESPLGLLPMMQAAGAMGSTMANVASTLPHGAGLGPQMPMRGGAPLPPPTAPNAQQQIQGLLAPSNAAMNPVMYGSLPFDGAPAGGGQPSGASLVGPEPQRQALLRANLAMMQHGTVEQAAEAQKTIERMLDRDPRTAKSEADDRHYWIDGPLAGKRVLPNVQAPNVERGPVPFADAKEDQFVRQIREMWKPVRAANPGLTQADADRFGAIMSTLKLDELETTVLPDRTISRPGIGAQRAIQGFLNEVGARASNPPPDVQRRMRGGGFMPPRPKGGRAAMSGERLKPLQLSEADRLGTAAHMVKTNDRLEEALEDFDATSMWNVGGAAFEAFPTLQAITTSPKWQRFNTNATRWSDMVLRLATGAQANESEVQKFKQMFMPVPGESALNVANKSIVRYEEALYRLQTGLLREDLGRQHPFIEQNRAMQQRIETVDLPRARANLQRVQGGLKPMTRKDWSVWQKKASKSKALKYLE